ncbi:MAG: anaerobic ribonucleoside-triphosphate reductase activating protein [Bacilli bacterium]
MDFSGIEKLSLVDFDDNITCTLFTSGCNFRCPFCQNSSLVLTPNEVIKIPWSDIYEYLTKRKGVLDAVCITGGEPTLMPDLKDKIIEIRKLGLKVKLDTNGSNLNVIKELVNEHLLDYIAMDIKNSFTNYNKTIGTNFDLNKIKSSIDYIMHCGVRYEFRTTMMKEYHSESDIVEIGEMLKGADRYFIQHFIDSEYCIKRGLHEIDRDTALNFKKILEKNIKSVELRGYDI